MCRQDLDRHVAVELYVAREVHDPHAAAAELALDGVLAGERRLQLEELVRESAHVLTPYARRDDRFRPSPADALSALSVVRRHVTGSGGRTRGTVSGTPASASARGTSSPSSNVPSTRAITTVARQLPNRLMDVRAMSISASTPRITATPCSGSPNWASAPERMTSDAR